MREAQEHEEKVSQASSERIGLIDCHLHEWIRMDESNGGWEWLGW